MKRVERSVVSAMTHAVRGRRRQYHHCRSEGLLPAGPAPQGPALITPFFDRSARLKRAKGCASMAVAEAGLMETMHVRPQGHDAGALDHPVFAIESGDVQDDPFGIDPIRI